METLEVRDCLPRQDAKHSEAAEDIDTEVLSRVHKAVEELLAKAGQEFQADRAYLFRFHGLSMSNTHEWNAPGVQGFREELLEIPMANLPLISSSIKSGKRVRLRMEEDSSALDYVEMSREQIEELVIVPVRDWFHVDGFLGLDRCSGSKACLHWDDAVLDKLELYGNAILFLISYAEFVSEVCLIANKKAARNKAFALKRLSQLYNLVMKNESILAAQDLISDLIHGKDFIDAPVLLEDFAVGEKFAGQRFAVVPANFWSAMGGDPVQLEDFKRVCQESWKEMTPDSGPYSRFRDVGYSRYRYENGLIYPLKHKLFFQLDPAFNVVVGASARPFVRTRDDFREHPALIHILQMLLEHVWGCELGSRVHINVHPVRVRNFDSVTEIVHNEMHTVFEGTHVDSMERVAVMLIERGNVKDSQPVTSLYSRDCAMGLRRDIPEDEEVLKGYRLYEHVLMDPLETLTFDDTAFKHDASDFHPEDETSKSWRSILLIMCRRPVERESFVDGHDIDGLTSRSSVPSLQ